MRSPEAPSRRAPHQSLQLHSVHRIPGRVFAVILDSMPITVVCVLVWIAVGGQAPGQSGYLLAALVATGLLVVYYTLFEATLGWTPGKLLTGLRVVDKAGLGKPSVGQAFVRNLLRPLDALFGYLVGFVTALSSTHRQRIGDHAAGTLVVDADYRAHMQEAESLHRRKQAGARAEERVSYELGKLAAFDGDYYVWNDLYEEGAGNIDHLVVGPGGLTIVETKSHKGLVAVQGYEPPTVDGRPLERDVLKQIKNQRRAVMRRVGFGDADPDRVNGFNWIICFARGQLAPDLAPNVRRRLATTRDLRGKIRSQPRTATPEQVLSMARTIEGLYGREPDHCPSGPREAEPDGHAGGR